MRTWQPGDQLKRQHNYRVEKQTKEEKKSQDKAEKEEDKGLQLIHLKEKVKSKELE